KPPAHLPQQNQPGVSAPATSGTSATAPAPAKTTPPAPPATISTAALPVAPLTEDTQERSIVVENDLYRVEFSNRGAVIKSWQLKKYKDDSKPQRVLDVVHPEAAQQTGGWPFSLVIDDPQLESAANSGLYQVSSGDAAVLRAPAEAEFSWSDGHLEVTK